MSTSSQVFLFTARLEVGPGFPACGQSLSPCDSKRLEQRGSEGRAGARVLVSRGAFWRRGPPTAVGREGSVQEGGKPQCDGVMGDTVGEEDVFSTRMTHKC